MFGSPLHRLTALAITTTLATGAFTLGVLPTMAASAAKPPPAPLTVTAICTSAVSGGFGSVSVSGDITGLRPKTTFGVTVNQTGTFLVTAADPVVKSDAKGVLILKAVTINAATDGNAPYASGAANLNALYTGLIGIQGGGQGVVADLPVTIDTSGCP